MTAVECLTHLDTEGVVGLKGKEWNAALRRLGPGPLGEHGLKSRDDPPEPLVLRFLWKLVKVTGIRIFPPQYSSLPITVMRPRVFAAAPGRN